MIFDSGDTGATGYDTGDITKSLRFRSSASAYLSRTPGSAGNRKTWTWSGWVKLGSLTGVQQFLFNAGPDANNRTQLTYENGGQLQLVHLVGGTAILNLVTTNLYRDFSAWYYIVVAFDSTQATAADRVKLYINGAQVTAFSTATYFAQNTDTFVNATNSHMIGRHVAVASNFLDGYLSRVCFVDGQALTPSSFGYLNTAINEWVSKSQAAVKAVVDAGGTNSFMLDFDNGSSLTTLGYDKSSKGNNWTLNNHSLTAGVTYDWMDDRPGNSYAVFSPLQKGSSQTLSNANLTDTAAATWASVVGTVGISSGKWYWEATLDSGTNCLPGICTATIGVSGAPGIDAFGWVYQNDTGKKYTGNIATTYGATWGVGDTVGVAFDADAGTLTFYKNNVSQGAAFTGLTAGPYFPVFGVYSSTGSNNFGQRPFQYTPPTGFKALCQANLPDPAITNPKKHFDVVTRAGTSASKTVSGIAFPPDLVWPKSRNQASAHYLFNSIVGATKFLSSSATSAETTLADSLTSFTADGYTFGVDSNNGVNWSSGTYVDWLWKAGGAAVTNNAGSITSQVSANVLAGFSIVTYTGTGANATVGHGLGVAPKMVIVKSRNGVGRNWPVYHAGMTAANVAYLNLTNAQVANAASWNSTAPTSTTFSLGSDTDPNESSKNYVAYCFAEIPGFSKIGSYTGNGSTDGPFVFCGFKPRFFLVKRTDSTGDWLMFDSAREPSNQMSIPLFADLSWAETGTYPVDFVANGIKHRNSAGVPNLSGATYIFIAIADVTGKYSNAR